MPSSGASRRAHTWRRSLFSVVLREQRGKATDLVEDRKGAVEVEATQDISSKERRKSKVPFSSVTIKGQTHLIESNARLTLRRIGPLCLHSPPATISGHIKPRMSPPGRAPHASTREMMISWDVGSGGGSARRSRWMTILSESGVWVVSTSLPRALFSSLTSSV